MHSTKHLIVKSSSKYHLIYFSKKLYSDLSKNNGFASQLREDNTDKLEVKPKWKSPHDLYSKLASFQQTQTADDDHDEDGHLTLEDIRGTDASKHASEQVSKPKFIRKFTKSSYDKSEDEKPRERKHSFDSLTQKPKNEEVTENGSRLAVDGYKLQEKRLEWARKNEQKHRDAMKRLHAKASTISKNSIDPNILDTVNEYRLKIEKLQEQKQKDALDDKTSADLLEEFNSLKEKDKKKGFFSMLFH